MNVKVQIPASCGELVQGYLDGNEFLINAPIPLFAEATLSYSECAFNKVMLEKKGFQKASQAVNNLIKQFNITSSYFNLEINSTIPRNKGLSSSTADVAAAILAVASAFRKNLAYDEISQLIIDVDGSSDAVFMEGITQINQLKGCICQQFYNIPNISFIIVDAGGEIKTQEFDRSLARWVAKKHEFSLKRALELLQKGFYEQNPILIAHAATISARINQCIHYKAPFHILLEGTREFGGLGVNCAHTGTVLGVIFDHTQTDAIQLEMIIRKLIYPLPILGTYPLISGSAEINRIDECEIIQKENIEDIVAMRFA